LALQNSGLQNFSSSQIKLDHPDHRTSEGLDDIMTYTFLDQWMTSTPDFRTLRVSHFHKNHPFYWSTKSQTIQRSMVLTPISYLRLEKSSGLRDSKVFAATTLNTSELEKTKPTDLMIHDLPSTTVGIKSDFKSSGPFTYSQFSTTTSQMVELRTLGSMDTCTQHWTLRIYYGISTLLVK